MRQEEDEKAQTVEEDSLYISNGKEREENKWMYKY